MKSEQLDDDHSFVGFRQKNNKILKLKKLQSDSARLFHGNQTREAVFGSLKTESMRLGG